VRVYVLVSSQVHCVIEVSSTREEAEEFPAEVRQDEPELAAMLGVEAIELMEEPELAE
jgi:hypothetical protein